MKLYFAFCFVFLNLALIGCGGGSSSASGTNETNTENETITTYTGVFIDSAVEGLQYETASQSGLTNANGEFIYQLGEEITFSIGGITFPMISVKSQLTPLDVFATEDYSHTGVINLARLLQSLDIDGIAENGLTLADNIHTLAMNLDLEFTASTFDSDVATLLSDNSSNNNALHIALISELDAISHLQTSLGDLDTSVCGSTHPNVGATSSFATIDHDVTGDAEIIDDCTIEITNFTYDATAPAVYFYGATSSNFSNGFTIGEELRNNGSAYQSSTITLKLPNNKTLDDLNYLSVWCVDFSVNFGDLTFIAP